MKKTFLAICATALLLNACTNADKPKEETTTTVAPTDTGNTKDEWVPVDSATATKAWMEYATPGEPHKAMAKDNGTWIGENTMWMTMDAPPTTSTCSITNKMLMGGRYQMAEFKGDFMGMPFEGMSITAYDNYKKKYISTWIDNMGTGIMKMEGTWDDASKSMTMTGKMTDPATGRECDMRQVYKVVDDDHQIMEMYGPDAKTGKEYKTMEIKLARKK